MLAVDDALQAVLGRVRPRAAVAMALADALGCVLGEDVAADIDLPPFDKSIVDGYAVRSADAAHPGSWLRVVEEVTAGTLPTRSLAPGEAAHIMTGAPLPDGADAVVMHEKARRDGDLVAILDPNVTPGFNRLDRGREVRRGERVLEAGTLLTPVRLGVLASVGHARVLAVPRPGVSVVPTGNELVEPDQVPGPGQIRNSNATLLEALARSDGAIATKWPVARDDPEALAAGLRRGLAADVLLVTGGVSAGTLDLVPSVLEAIGVARVFHKVRLKPGKPLWFGVWPGSAAGEPERFVFALPGNPVSGLVGYLLFVRPAPAVLAGRCNPVDRSCDARLDRPFQQKGERTTYHPSVLVPAAGGLPAVVPLEWSGSADLRTVALATGFAVFPAGDRSYRAGEIVRYLPLG